MKKILFAVTLAVLAAAPAAAALEEIPEVEIFEGYSFL